jgi:hypothetical protein
MLYRPLATGWRFYDNASGKGPRLLAAGRGSVETRVSNPRLWQEIKLGYAYERIPDQPLREKSVEELFEDGTEIDEALRQAVREALIVHKKLGHSIVVWEDGKLQWIPPEEIDVEDGEAREPPGGEPGSLDR